MIETQVVQEREGICGGYPCVGNSRIPVRSLVLSYRALDTFERVVETFPTLSPDQIRAALDWYIKHPDRVDEDIRRNEETLREVAGPAMAGLGIKLFTDEMITPRLADEMRRRGYDVESCRDAGRSNQGIPDEDQLRYCASVGRTIYTFNTTDYDSLDRWWHAWNLTHGGIIVSEDLNGTFDEMVRRLQYHLDAVKPAMQVDRLLILSR